MNCPNCNNPLSPNSKFCGACGAPVPQKPVQGEETQIADELITPATHIYQPENEISPQTTEVPPQNYDDPFRKEASSFPQPENEFGVSQGGQAGFAPQYQQYSPYPGDQPQNGGQPPKKNSKTPLIVVIIVLSVLLIGGGVFAAIMIINSNKGDSGEGKSSSSASSQSSALSSVLSSHNIFDSSDDDRSSKDSEPSYYSSEDDSSSYSSAYSSDDSSSSRSVVSKPSSSGSHAIENDEGVEIADDPAINADDTEAEEMLYEYFEDYDAESIAKAMENDQYTAEIYARGNAIVYELTFKNEIGDLQKEALKTSVKQLETSMSSTVRQARSESGVNDAVMVYAYMDADGNLIASAVCQ